MKQQWVCQTPMRSAVLSWRTVTGEPDPAAALDPCWGGQELWIVNAEARVLLLMSWGAFGTMPSCWITCLAAPEPDPGDTAEPGPGDTAAPKQQWQLGIFKPRKQSSSDQKGELQGWLLISPSCSLLFLSLGIIFVCKQILHSTSEIRFIAVK